MQEEGTTRHIFAGTAKRVLNEVLELFLERSLENGKNLIKSPTIVRRVNFLKITL